MLLGRINAENYYQYFFLLTSSSETEASQMELELIMGAPSISISKLKLNKFSKVSFMNSVWTMIFGFAIFIQIAQNFDSQKSFKPNFPGFLKDST